MKKVLVLGGDLRQLTAYEEFKNYFDTLAYGFDNKFDIKTEYNLKAAIQKSDIIVLPLPVSKDDLILNAPLFSEEILLSDIIELLDDSKIIIGGMFSDRLKQKFRDFKIYDYFEREELAVLNAIPTAEGAIEIAIEETPFTLWCSNCLITGFGRIGKVLARLLQAFGANVTVSARRPEDFAWISTYGYNYIHTDELEECVGTFDIIFNTIPYNIFNEQILKQVKKDELIIDLASKPGGVNFEAAKYLGVKVIWALSLPGKTSPQTAGIIIKDTILNILKELGV